MHSHVGHDLPLLLELVMPVAFTIVIVSERKIGGGARVGLRAKGKKFAPPHTKGLGYLWLRTVVWGCNEGELLWYYL